MDGWIDGWVDVNAIWTKLTHSDNKDLSKQRKDAVCVRQEE